ncbi:hypothetical protein LSTR_LSTR003869 [Laodelphax striatellus]|uniref:Uncharacterized protein n=1 Tax=Laodelphax striatellus TaxID=195883 RepID=A0A482XFG8_LAOST|nr:hypothetical protein LSTR_LSTR003869 [Laodelphax striatellus]
MTVTKSMELEKTVTVGWIIAVVSLLAALFGVYPFVQSNFTHDRITDSLYKAFHRSLFGLGGAWIIYVCYTGQSEILNQILSSPALQPLGKVSYCLYGI